MKRFDPLQKPRFLIAGACGDSSQCQQNLLIHSLIHDTYFGKWQAKQETPLAGWTSRSLHNEELHCCRRRQRGVKGGPPHRPRRGKQTWQNRILINSVPAASDAQPNQLGPWKHIVLRLLVEFDLHLKQPRWSPTRRPMALWVQCFALLSLQQGCEWLNEAST